MIRVFGYGSLLSEGSARETVPGLERFRLVRVPGYRRIFNKVGVVFFSRHRADPASLEIASCSTEPAPGCEIICSAFDCPEADFEALYEREHRFRWIEVEAREADGSIRPGRICTRYSDEEYRLNKCITEAEYQRRVGQYYPGRLWRDDILPFPRYLRFCLQAAASQGPEVLDNFLDSSFLADGRTRLRHYLERCQPPLDWQSEIIDYGYGRRG
ncbi:gamma-glutamylcyclotransferase family protein [Marinobacterium aestuariivivens]|uniref:Gamma-glutamylcyclotransferase family protein n=1 Tax=Marinobacterium aestuariivivens TaxID=1698799 RepID=A0ABW1ZVU2_9GAMM